MHDSHAGSGRRRWLLAAVVLLMLAVSPVSRGSQSNASASVDFESLAGRFGWAEAFARVHGYPDGLPRVREGSSSPQPASHAVAEVSWLPTGVVYLPIVSRFVPKPMMERRALWITRYDWTTLTQAPAPSVIDTMVANAASAHLNTLLFQVRAAGDAYYTPGLEPWAARLTTGPISVTLGIDPGWDPLQHMLDAAHAAGLEVHAYVNVYPAWLSPLTQTYGLLWPPATVPPQMFDRFTYGPSYLEHPGEYSLGFTWRHYDSSGQYMPLSWNQYLWASPGLDEVQSYIAAVVRDIVARYAVDGVHLDLVRYAGSDYSYDPFSNAAAGAIKTAARDQWQRDRVTALVQQIADDTHAVRPNALVSAAVWPYYMDLWNWGLSEGYSDYYQDSKGWLAQGAVDAIAPMLYGSRADDFEVWQILAADFIGADVGGQVYPGIGAHYASFDAVSDRIEAARQMGAPGHVLFSYGYVDRNGYWDDLLAGPYQQPAQPPPLP